MRRESQMGSSLEDVLGGATGMDEIVSETLQERHTLTLNDLLGFPWWK